MTKITTCIICHNAIIEDTMILQVHPGDCARVASLAMQLGCHLPPNLRRHIQSEFDEAYQRVFNDEH